MIKVLIVEDSRTVSQYLEYILGNDPGIEIIGNVANGKMAVDFVKKNKPDIITMDIDMPVMNGLEATREIMSSIPVPIVIVTGSRNARKINLVVEALAAGALIVVEKPVGIGHPNEAEKTKKMLSMVKTFSQVKVIKRIFKPNQKRPEITNAKPKINNGIPDVSEFLQKKYVAIGISTGGPQVLAEIFSQIPIGFPFPILVVQHISKGFLEGMVTWLNRLCQIPIHIAANAEKPLPGHIYFAPDSFQMGVQYDQIVLEKYRENMKICPSVEALFNSLSINNAKDTIALLLTGMGNDGATGIKALKDAGAITIAQDKESSLVHGMPGEAIKLNGATYILNPAQIIELLLRIEKHTLNKT